MKTTNMRFPANTRFRLFAYRDNGPTVSSFVQFFATRQEARDFAKERGLKVGRITGTR